MSDDSMQENMTDESVIGARLKEARAYLGLTQEFVADQLSIPRPAVSQIEHGTRRVSGSELKKLALLYGRPVGWFVGDFGELLGADEQTAALFRATSGLEDSDMEEVVRFAEFLRSRIEPKNEQ